jgi:hypothetical protein
MCKVSDKLKLCTCKAENVEKLKHYWVLNRYHRRNDCIMGEILPPPDIGEIVEKYNIGTLLKLLNEGNCFDTELQLKQNDILELHFTLNPEKYFGNYLAYAFVFKNNKWKVGDYDPFGNNMEEIQNGKILRPFAKRTGS